MKAMIFAAGRGERMRPLTDTIPKALVQAQGEPLIAHALRACARVGIQDVVINVALQHLGEKIMTTLGNGRDFGVNIQYSIEDAALETGGGIIKALPLLGDAPFITISCDIWSDYDLKQLIDKAPSVKAGHLVMVDNPDFHPEGDFHLTPEGLIHLEGQPKFTYGNMGIFNPAIFKGRSAQSTRLAAILKEYMNEDAITGEHFSGRWMNIGTQGQLQALDETLRQIAAT